MGRSEANGTPWWSRERLRDALVEHNGNKTAVADEWGTSYETIRRWTQKHDLEHLAWDSEDGLHPDWPSEPEVYV